MEYAIYACSVRYLKISEQVSNVTNVGQKNVTCNDDMMMLPAQADVPICWASL